MEKKNFMQTRSVWRESCLFMVLLLRVGLMMIFFSLSQANKRR
jgi:hypothetical protein